MVVVVVMRLGFSVVIVVFVGFDDDAFASSVCIGGSVVGVRVVSVDVGRWG